MKEGKLILLAGLLALINLEAAGSIHVSGTVFLDTNQNGKLDAGEKRLSKMAVSNGDTIVLTDKNGRYILPAEGGFSIFPIPESGIRTNTSVRNSGFFYIQPKEASSPEINFPLVQETVQTSFRLAIIGDIQVDDEQEINYTNRTLVPDLMNRKDIALNLVMGDLVNNRMDLLPTVKEMLATLPAPSWAISGNHDRLIGTDLPLEHVFHENFGASTYSFNYGNVHFIVLNNVYAKGKAGYEGRLSERQLRFLSNDLKRVSTQQKVIVAMHIPLKETKNKEELLNLLSPYKNTLILSAHLHSIERVFHQTPGNLIPEWTVGATCGSFWTGERDQEGIPGALMQDGSPRNYFVLDITPENYRMHYKGIGLDPDRQMNIWVNQQDTLDAHTPVWSSLPPQTVLANIFAGSDSTEVWMQIDGQPATRMEKTLLASPNISSLANLGKTDVYPTINSKRAAVRQSPSPHLWRGQLPANQVKGVHTIRISAKDAYGFEATSSQTYLIW
jgi:predicted phosphohydrolase